MMPQVSRSGSRAGSFVTSADVAVAAGVSRSAVSRAFTPGGKIAPQTRAHIHTMAKKLGYRVNRVAQNLINARSDSVGLIGANLDAPFHARQVAFLSAALVERGMQCLLLNAKAHAHLGPAMERLLESRVRAVVILSGTPPASLVDECLKNGMRVILINRHRLNAADAIMTDDAGGAALAFETLREAGCRQLGLVGSNAATSSITQRMKAFHKAAAEAGIKVVAWDNGPTAYESGVAAASVLLRQRVDGVFCVTDLLALGFLDAARYAYGKAVPNDLSVIGFDDIPQADWLAYRLTTLRQPLDTMTDAVMQLLDDPAAPDIQRLMLPVALIERDTVRSRGFLQKDKR